MIKHLPNIATIRFVKKGSEIIGPGLSRSVYEIIRDPLPKGITYLDGEGRWLSLGDGTYELVEQL